TGEELFGNPVERRAALLEQRLRALVVHRHEPLDLVVDADRGVFAVVLMLRDLAAEEDLLFLLAEGERPHRVAHAPLAHHLAGELGRALQIVAGASRHAAARQLLGQPAAEQNRDLVVEVVARVVELVAFRQLHRDAERHAARDDRDLVDRIGVRQQHREQRVSGFVDRRDLLLGFGDDHGPALRSHHHLVLRELEVVHPPDLLVVARRVERGLVHQVRDVGAREARRAARQHVDVHVVCERDLLSVDGEDALAPFHVRTVDDDAAVEAAGPQQRRVEDVGPVRGGDEDDAFVRLEPVHLDEELVERLLALVVAAAEAGAAMTADRVDLVDEDDARRVLLALLEQIADAAGADADEHFDEIGAADREERNVGFTRDRAREQRLARSRRAHEEHALRDAPAELLELLRLLEELDDLLELFLRFVDAGEVWEGAFLRRARGELRGALAERQGLVPAALHLPHDEQPEADHEQDRRPRVQQRRPGTCRLGLGRDLDVPILEFVGETLVLRRRVGAELGVAVPGGGGGHHAGDLAAGDRDGEHLALLDVLEELREGDLVLAPLERGRKVPDEEPHCDEDHPEQQALEGRVQPTPPKCLTFKSITPRDGSVTRKPSAPDCPTTQTFRSRPSTTSGTVSRWSRRTFRSTRKSCNFRGPGAPRGWKRSPGRRLRTA